MKRDTIVNGLGERYIVEYLYIYTYIYIKCLVGCALRIKLTLFHRNQQRLSFSLTTIHRNVSVLLFQKPQFLMQLVKIMTMAEPNIEMRKENEIRCKHTMYTMHTRYCRLSGHRHCILLHSIQIK